MATLTLDKMAQGGIYDQLGGGFHRYSTERTWTVPHFEKMLYDNAQLAEIYAQAYQITKKPLYRRVLAGDAGLCRTRDDVRRRAPSIRRRTPRRTTRKAAVYVWTPRGAGRRRCPTRPISILSARFRDRARRRISRASITF